ncbi:transcriptional activator RamA [Klebsiella michiganensis]|uniref:Transcriptional activator RamA n=1 Tax=Klebsiella michiganensis TaxID=1134687 RepID=A0A7H4N276_9ENTR|nr:transcriptional activator RamA [Klebsiella michiganensis]
MFISEAVIAVIIDWIDNNLHKPLRIEQIARYSGYSKWYLQRLFLQYRGESLGRYIRNKKLDSAAAIYARPMRTFTVLVCATAMTRSKHSPDYLRVIFICRPVNIARKTKQPVTYRVRLNLNLLSDSPGKAAAEKSMRRDLSKNRKTDSAEKTKPPVL